MIGRHIIFAGLFAAASFANAGTVELSSATVQPAWSFNSGMTAAAAPAAFQSMMAGPGMLSTHSRRGDIGSNSMTLFSQPGAGPAPAVLSSTVAAASEVALVAPAAPAEVALAAPAEVALAAPAATELPVAAVNPDIILSADAINPAAIPEPATGMLMLAGLLGAGFISRRRK